jgi:hypothetical protein
MTLTVPRIHIRFRFEVERAEAVVAAAWLHDVGDAPSARSASLHPSPSWPSLDCLLGLISIAMIHARYKANASLQGARELNAMSLSANVYDEAAWQLRMRIAHAHGDLSGVLDAFRGCERALAELGTTPSRGTRALLEDLRA